VPSIRDIRLAAGHSQRSFALLLDVPFETYRPLDGDAVPYRLHSCSARRNCLREPRWLTSSLFKPRTLRAAARDGRLRVQFSTRSVFGRPIRRASRAAIDEFVRLHYRQRYSRYATPLPRPSMPVVPTNFASQLIRLRLRLRLTQAELARRIGAANKSVIYQWETRRRTPSVVFWVRV
jgi:DNA-binding transcriptional regulator YiaG